MSSFEPFFKMLHISDIIWYLSLSIWLTSLTMIISRPIHVASNGIISFSDVIQSHHFMANRWGNSGNSGWLYFGGSKITADGDWSHEIKRYILLRRKVMTKLDSIFKSRDIILPTKVHLVKAMVFPVVMYGCESWIIKKAEPWRIDAFELWCWRRLLRVLGLWRDPTSPS